MVTSKKSSKRVYQLRIDLMDSKPPIWRHILIEGSATLYDLHCAIQNAMGWYNGYLHGFEKDNDYFGPKDEEYNFGDGWRHRVRLEKIRNKEPNEQLPRCIKGKLACPPEDVGGVWGYYEVLAALQDKTHPDHAHFAEWIGVDIAWFV